MSRFTFLFETKGKGTRELIDALVDSGGFAHVYLVKTQELINGTDRHVLKRVAVREKSLLDEVRREVEVMVSFKRRGKGRREEEERERMSFVAMGLSLEESRRNES